MSSHAVCAVAACKKAMTFRGQKNTQHYKCGPFTASARLFTRKVIDARRYTARRFWLAKNPDFGWFCWHKTKWRSWPDRL